MSLQVLAVSEPLPAMATVSPADKVRYDPRTRALIEGPIASTLIRLSVPNMIVMLTQMMSAGAMGGGMSSAIARALGAGRRDDANALALHAVVIALVFGVAFTIAPLAGGPSLYAAMGGS